MPARRSTQPPTPAEPLNVAIIGAGQMGQQHARAIARLTGVRISAVVESDANSRQKFMELYPSATAFPSLEQLLSSHKADVVHICTPPQTHEKLAEQALAGGCHIYVEKPFVESKAKAVEIVDRAARLGLKVCAGHQLLHEPPTRRALALLPALGQLTHVESYFSFRAMKHSQTGRPPLRDDLQLLDILPHPVYLLLDFLERAADGVTELVSVEVGPRGTVHALVRRGSLVGTLVVTLEGRPVESYLRLVGTNGSLHADYVRSTVQRNLGPGASGIDKLISPYRLAGQLLMGTTSALGKRFIKGQKSYPGLAEIFAAFYEAVRTGGPSPVSRTNLVETVGICQSIADALAASSATTLMSAPRLSDTPTVVTGGTGFLGKEVVKALLQTGEGVRVVARRAPPDWDRIAGVEYIEADLSRPLPPAVMHHAKAVVHCAAETAGGWAQHETNSIAATENVVVAAASAGVKRLVHISTISVLAVPRRGEKLTEDGALEPDARTGGPYAWGKIESEKVAVRRCNELGIELRIVRPSALVDYAHFDPPGLLGKRIGNTFVAVGMPYHKLGIVDVTFSAQTIVWIVRHFDKSPDVINLFEPTLPTKRDLLIRLRQTNPDIGVVWLPPVVLVPLSWLAIGAQKLLRPRQKALNVAKIFARLDYDTARISSLASEIKAEFLNPAAASAAASGVSVPNGAPSVNTIRENVSVG